MDGLQLGSREIRAPAHLLGFGLLEAAEGMFKSEAENDQKRENAL